jgi:hypothetical protein
MVFALLGTRSSDMDLSRSGELSGIATISRGMFMIHFVGSVIDGFTMILGASGCCVGTCTITVPGKLMGDALIPIRLEMATKMCTKDMGSVLLLVIRYE